MLKDSLNEREFELVNILGYKLESSQRGLSRQLNLSLGATNILIRRLITKGYIRVQQLNKKKVQYLLTSKGFTEKMNKSIKYTLATVRHITLLQEALGKILNALHAKGYKKFYIAGNSGLVEMVTLVFYQILPKECTFVCVKEISSEMEDGCILVCEEGMTRQNQLPAHAVDLIAELAKSKGFIDQAVLQ